MSLYKYLATSDNPLPRLVRRTRRAAREFTLPAPRVVVRPILWAFLALREVWHYVRRVLIVEPLFKGYCTRYGQRVRTGIFLHWVDGKGDILLGDDVLIDGKCAFLFDARYNEHPTLEVGDHTVISHKCQFTIGRRITIGRHCLIAANACFFDSDGYPTDPSQRLSGVPPSADHAQAIVLEDNVWVGTGVFILKGVTIGSGSVVAAGSVVTKDVPPNVVVAGNPARIVKQLAEPRRVGAAPATVSPLEHQTAAS